MDLGQAIWKLQYYKTFMWGTWSTQLAWQCSKQLYTVVKQLYTVVCTV